MEESFADQTLRDKFEEALRNIQNGRYTYTELENHLDIFID